MILLSMTTPHDSIVSGPDVVNRGFVHEETSGDILEEARNRVMLSLKESGAVGVIDRVLAYADAHDVSVALHAGELWLGLVPRQRSTARSSPPWIR